MRKNISGVDYDMTVPDRGACNDSRYFVNIDPQKCSGCGICRETCPTGAIRGNIGSPHEIPHVEPCIHCGLCLVHCPERAIYETGSWLGEIRRKLADPKTVCIALPAPAIRHAVKEFYGQSVLSMGKLRGAFDALGFRHCWDVQFGADVTIQEEGTEFLNRLQGNGPLPQLSSCCPSWVRFAETYYPEILPHVSTVKSPVMINGRIAKTYAATKYGYDAAQIYTVAIVPCVAKKYEALRPDASGGAPDIDAVLTTRELLHLLENLDMKLLPSLPEDAIMGASSWSGAKFCVGGGVMEAVLRFVSYAMTDNINGLDLGRTRERSGIRAMDVNLYDYTYKFATVCGANNFPHICNEIANGKSPYDFIEFMACPGGCIGGGGQPLVI